MVSIKIIHSWERSIQHSTQHTQCDHPLMYGERAKIIFWKGSYVRRSLQSDLFPFKLHIESYTLAALHYPHVLKGMRNAEKTSLPVGYIGFIQPPPDTLMTILSHGFVSQQFHYESFYPGQHRVWMKVLHPHPRGFASILRRLPSLTTDHIRGR